MKHFQVGDEINGRKIISLKAKLGEIYQWTVMCMKCKNKYTLSENSLRKKSTKCRKCTVNDFKRELQSHANEQKAKQ